jgi:WD40 repeat protein/serine/threonine protein kinase
MNSVDPDPTDSLLGQVIDNKYDIQEWIGQGGMGKVYRVRDWDWNVDLAIKVPAPHVISDWVARERFILEAQTWIELGLHPNIVQCWFVREHEGHPLVFMDYLPAGSLKEWRTAGRVQPGQWSQILDLMLQACAGLSHAHELGLVHRDVKPANLLMHHDGRLCVTDFGLVKVTHLDPTAPSEQTDWKRVIEEMRSRKPGDSLLSSLTLTGTSTMLGTPEYGAPEQWMAASSVNTGADIYALGVILFELCAGRRPFDDGVKKVSTALMLGEHLMTPAPDPRTFNADIPASLAQLCLQCLTKDPLDRPSSMPQLRAELERIYREVVGVPYSRPFPRAGARRADALNNKAVSLWHLGFQQKAFEAWREASQLDGLHPETVYNRTMIQWRQGQIEESEVRHRLAQIKSAYPHLGIYLGYFYLDQGSPLQAEQEIQQALTHPLASRHGSAWRALGDARMYQEDYPGATEAYDQALLRMPDDREARARREMAAQNLRQRERVLFPRLRPHCPLSGQDSISSVALSQDGQQAVHWSQDSLRLWNTREGSTVWVWRDPKGSSPNRLTLERDWILSLDSPGGRCWSRHNGQLLLELKSRKRFLAVARQANWALAGGEELEQIELPGGQVLQALTGHSKSIACADLSRDGKLAITGSGDRSVRLWDLEQAVCMRVLEGHSDRVEAVQLSPDGALAISGSRDKTVRIWQVADGTCLWVLSHTQEVRRIHLSGDGHYLWVGLWSVGEKDRFDCWEMATGQRRFSGVGGHWLYAFQLGPWALVASKVSRPGPLTLWENQGGRVLRAYAEHPSGVTALDVSRDERLALTGSADGSLRLWEVDWGARVGEFSLVVNRTSDYSQVESTQQLFLRHLEKAGRLCQSGDPGGAYRQLAQARAIPGYTRDPAALALNAQLLQRLSRRGIASVWQRKTFSSHGLVTALQLSSDSMHALSASGRVLYLWELSTGSCVRGFTGHSDTVSALALSHDQTVAASVSHDRTLRLWSLGSGECVQVFRFDQPLVDVRIDQRGNILVASRERLYGCCTGPAELIFESSLASIGCLAVSRNGRLALSGSQQPNSLTLWKLPGSKPFRPWRPQAGVPEALGDGSCTAISLSEDGRYCVTGDRQGWLRIFDIEDGHCKNFWQAHEHLIQRVELSSDGRVAVSASEDGTVVCSEVVSGRCWETLQSQAGPTRALAISADARFILSSGTDSLIRLWELDWDLQEDKESTSLVEAWRKSTVLERLGGLFRKRG